MVERKPEDYYELIGLKFNEFMSPYDVERRTNVIRKLWPRRFRGTCLEVGCGTGAITRGIRDLTIELTVSDLSESLAREVARENGCNYLQADATQLPFSDSSFDLVYSSECLEHTPYPSMAVGEMVRVCKKGGYVIITTPNKLWYPLVRFGQMTRLRKFQGNEIFLWPWELRKSLEISGARIIQFSGCHLYPWQIPIPKQVLRSVDRLAPWLYRLMINQAVLAVKL